MKTNKFRSWDKINKKYYYFENGEYFGYWDNEKWEAFQDLFDWENAEQFTGLHDKNGKEIYEGDICKNSELWEVIFFLGSFMFARLPRKIRIYHLHQIEDVELAGNIHENPELQEVTP